MIEYTQTDPEYVACLLDVGEGAGDGHLVALLLGVGAVGVGEVDVAAGAVHHRLDRVPTLADDMRVLHVPYVHLQHHLAPPTAPTLQTKYTL